MSKFDKFDGYKARKEILGKWIHWEDSVEYKPIKYQKISEYRAKELDLKELQSSIIIFWD